VAEWLFDQHGDAQLIFDADRFVDKGGFTVGWHYQKCVYSTMGKHLGWYDKGALSDSANKVVGFTGNLVGVVLPPIPTLNSTPSLPSFVAFPGAPSFNPILSPRRRTRVWSTVKLEEYFVKH